MSEKIKFASVKEQMEVIRRGVSEIIPEDELIKKLEKSIESGKPLNIKLGCDPTRPDLHLGHSVVLRKLAQFQELGHQAILIIGDFTALIGDPSGRNSTRPPLTEAEIVENAKSYFEQAYKILDKEKTKIVYNSEWLGKMNFADVIKLASKYTVARMMERDDFTNRFKEGVPISMHEILYPLAQAMDSVAIKSDVELGGTDQKFNLLVGRDIQRENDMAPQITLTMPILVGTDGVEKMSKSYDNYIGISDSPKDIYGKTLSIPDNTIYNYYEVATDISADELAKIKLSLEDGSGNPRDIKRALARKLVEMYHSLDAANQAEQEFDNIFINKGIPDDIPEYKSDVDKTSIIDLIMAVNFAPSKGEARRLIQQGGVSIDGEKITELYQEIIFDSEKVLKVGKRKFIKLLVSKKKNNSAQMVTGKAFEYAILKEFHEKLETITTVEVIKNNALAIAKSCFDEFDKQEKGRYLLTASFAVNFLIDIEPRLSNDLGKEDKLQLEILTDNQGQSGDVRDVLAIRKLQEWEIGVSAKNNHSAVKHSRLSNKIDFGEKWLGLKCSKKYFDVIEPIFSSLAQMQKESNRTKTWKSLGEYHSTVYIPILDAFKEELNRIYLTDKTYVASRLVEYLVGTKDFYKVIKRSNLVEIQAYNIHGSLNQAFKDIEPKFITPKIPLPNKILDISYKKNSDTTLIVELNNDWKLSFRIHNASSRIESSLKFDIKLLNAPNSLFTNQLSIPEGN